MDSVAQRLQRRRPDPKCTWFTTKEIDPSTSLGTTLQHSRRNVMAHGILSYALSSVACKHYCCSSVKGYDFHAHPTLTIDKHNTAQPPHTPRASFGPVMSCGAKSSARCRCLRTICFSVTTTSSACTMHVHESRCAPTSRVPFQVFLPDVSVNTHTMQCPDTVLSLSSCFACCADQEEEEEDTGAVAPGLAPKMSAAKAAKSAAEKDARIAVSHQSLHLPFLVVPLRTYSCGST